MRNSDSFAFNFHMQTDVLVLSLVSSTNYKLLIPMETKPVKQALKYQFKCSLLGSCLFFFWPRPSFVKYFHKSFSGGSGSAGGVFA